MLGHQSRPRFAFGVLFMASTAENVVYVGPAPVLPEFLSGGFNAGPSQIGLIVAMAPMAFLLFQPMTGWAADHLGCRRAGLAGTLAAIAGLVVIMLAWTAPMVGIGRALVGAGAAAIATATMSWVVAITPRAQLGRALSLFGLSIWAGMSIGPLVTQNVYQRWGATEMWATTIAVATLCAIGFAAAGRTPSSQADGITSDAPKSGVLRAVARPGCTAAIAWAVEGAVTTYAVVHLVSQGLPATGAFGAAGVFPVFAVSVVTSRLLFGRLLDTVRPAVVAIAGHGALAVACLMLSAADTFLMAAAAAILLGVGFAPLYPALALLVTDGVAPRSRGSALGLFNAATATGIVLGQVAGGLVLDHASTSAVFVAAAALQAIGIALLLVNRSVDTGHGHSTTTTDLGSK